MKSRRFLYLATLLMTLTLASKADDSFQPYLRGELYVPGKDPTSFENAQVNNVTLSDSGSFTYPNGITVDGTAAINNRLSIANGQLEFVFSGNIRGNGPGTAADAQFTFVLQTPMYYSLGGHADAGGTPQDFCYVELDRISPTSPTQLVAAFGVRPNLINLPDPPPFHEVLPAGSYSLVGVGRNRSGSSLYSGWLKLTPFALPSATTGAPTFGTDPLTVTLHGSVNPNGQASGAFFMLGRTTKYELEARNVQLNPIDGSTAQAVSSSPIAGLAPGTKYHCRLVAYIANSNVYFDGNDVEFVTPSGGSVIQFASDNYSVSRIEQTAKITVDCLGGSTQPLTGVSWSISDGTALAGTDYQDNSSVHTLSWPIGDNQSKQFPVTILPLPTAPPKTVILTLNSPTGGATLGARTKATLTISDDGMAAPPPLEIGSVTFLPSGGVHLQCAGKQNTACQIESSSDLNFGFSPLATVYSDASGSFHYNDYTNAAQKFYRLRLAP